MNQMNPFLRRAFPLLIIGSWLCGCGMDIREVDSSNNISNHKKWIPLSDDYFIVSSFFGSEETFKKYFYSTSAELSPLDTNYFNELKLSTNQIVSSILQEKLESLEIETINLSVDETNNEMISYLEFDQEGFPNLETGVFTLNTSCNSQQSSLLLEKGLTKINLFTENHFLLLNQSESKEEMVSHLKRGIVLSYEIEGPGVCYLRVIAYIRAI